MSSIKVLFICSGLHLGMMDSEYFPRLGDLVFKALKSLFCLRYRMLIR